MAGGTALSAEQGVAGLAGGAGPRALDPFERAGGWLRSAIASSVAHPGDGTDRGLADVCRAVLALDALGQVTALPQAFRASCARAIDLLQDPGTGLFAERAGATPDPSFPLDEVRSTRLAAQALDALGRRPAYPLAFATSWVECVRGWPDSIDWGHPDGVEEVTLALLLLAHRAEIDADAQAPAQLHAALDALERAQDGRTGLWGGETVPLARRIEATFRIVSFLQYTHRPVQRVTRILDAVLSACPAEGGLGELLHDPAGAVTAVSLLAGLPGAGHAAEASARALTGAYADVLALQEPSGAFRAGAGDQGEAGEVRRTWLRVATLALIARRHPDVAQPPVGWRAPRRPAPGYSPPAAVLTEHERQVAPLWIRALPELEARLGERGAAVPDVSVIVPCHDLGRYLHEALASVAAQRAPAVEIVVVDDGSTDEFTALVLAHWRTRGLRVLAQDHAAPAGARNLGVRETLGRWVCCLDADDRLRPEFLARAADVLDARPEIGLVSGHVQLFDERDELLGLEVTDLVSALADNTAASASLFRREAWERVGGYHGGWRTSGIEDWDFWLRLLEAGWRAHTLPQPVLDQRIRAGELSEGMYDPATRAPLVEELVARHGDAYAQHAGTVFVAQHRRWAELRAQAAELERSAASWRAQALAWRQRAVSAEGTLRAREALDAAVERERAWWESHARTWAREAADAESALAAQKQWIAELERARAWWETQSTSWQAAATERDRKIEELRGWIEELERGKSWWEEQAARLQRRAGDRKSGGHG
jgi:hypothetical protein